MNKFDVINQKLEGKYIIEASAGTGKTFSIAILYLRMLLFSNTDVKDILVVTFTNAAVAELRIRIRDFILFAYQNFDQSEEQSDDLICIILQQAKQQTIDQHNNPWWLKDRLLLALDNMDHAQIVTIHSFCQQVLTEHAFQSGVSFSFELQENLNELIQEAALSFWRDIYSQLDADLISKLGLSISIIKSCLKEHFNGRKFGSMQEGITDITTLQDLQNMLSTYEGKLLSVDKKLEELFEKYQQLHAATIASSDKRKLLYIKLNNIYDNKEAFIAACKKIVVEKKSVSNIEALVSEFVHQIELWFKHFSEFENQFRASLITLLILKYAPIVDKIKSQTGKLGFEDLIRKLHQAVVVAPNQTLIDTIRAQYKAVFIDEFQDTDKTQFEVFKALYLDEHTDTSLFLIGDPKQSIYGFRNADVDSYLFAKELIPLSNQFTMEMNYRSNADYIQELNQFFNRVEDPFLTNNRICYASVLPSSKVDGYVQVPNLNTNLNFFENQDKNEVVLNLCHYIEYLLDKKNNCLIKDDGEDKYQRPIQPSDICVLVRKKDDGRSIKRLLQRKNIPAVQLMDTSVFETFEATGIRYLFEAMLLPNSQNIQKVFSVTFANSALANDDEIKLIGLDLEVINKFQHYKNSLFVGEVYKAFSIFLDDFNLRKLLSESNKTLRSLANIEQLIQILQEQQYRSQCSPDELLTWFHNTMSDDTLRSSKAYNIQVEDEESAVSIVTIHKSKGLEYRIVFIVGIDATIKLNNKHTIASYKKDNLQYFDLLQQVKSSNIESLYIEQEKQEYRRLLYVALTRAKYSCNVFLCNSKNLTTFSNFLEPNLITPNFDEVLQNKKSKYKPKSNAQLTPISLPGYINTAISNWSLLSFSAMNTHHENEVKSLDDEMLEPLPTLSSKESELYDNFIFHQLKKCANVGIKLHSLFENIDFSDNYKDFNSLIYQTQFELRRFSQKDKMGMVNDDNTQYIQALLNHVLNVNLNVEDEKAFKLSELKNEKKLTELKFNFHIHSSLEAFRNTVAQYQYPVKVRSGLHLTGLLTGFIDLFFEHDGRYYILDWKSNYLGDTLKDYSKFNIINAMNTSNYHLQYLIYTVAIHKYLQSRLPNYNYETHYGGVIYLFLRGVRVDNNSGIFTCKPPEDLILQLSTLLQE